MPKARRIKRGKKFFKKIWYFIWEEDSLLSWIVNIILAFVLVKFIIYPGLAVLLATSYPIVAVISSSMEHEGSFDDFWGAQGNWYINNNIEKDQFKKFPFYNGFNKGDIMVLHGFNLDNLEIGDVIVFQGNKKEPIIHRIVKIDKEKLMQTKGDHNMDSFKTLGEMDIQKERVIGEAFLRVPLLGWVKIVFVDFVNSFKGG